ncbi:PQQ-binding-like beta-propeller repeat protein [Isoptericola sp. S6320L]|uniref:outer membrane protein assembly factor BamB family protein n=1 Tax=Isoptericola sp. S6320L TaxID=2926411 RepID=UPI001FF26566|nr:PQQ-binding-like beta-propeller repeat protein [Isoptericola sp. S6320L]MCK0117513.1 PQQ-binding-like beta-propeller repeat protein [Isoptericola sp. S6320L]
MARRRDPGMVSFDVSSDNETEGADGGAPAGPHGPAGPGSDDGWFVRRVGRPVARRWSAVPRRVRRITVTATAAVLVLGTGAAVAVDHHRDTEHAERLAAAPGGVVDLSAPVEPTWEVASDQGVLAVLPDGVVVTTAGSEVLAVEAASGAEVWRHDLGVQPDCGPRQRTPADLTRPVDRVVCLSGAPSRTVTVVDASGEVLGQRDIGPAATTQDGQMAGEGDGPVREAVPAAGGAVAVLERSDLVLDSATSPAEAFAVLEERRAEGTWRDPVLRIEDARTGEVRVEETLEVGRDDLEGCGLGSWSDEPGGQVWLTAHLGVEPAGTGFSFCGLGVWIAADGTVQDAFPRGTVDGDLLEYTEAGTRIVSGDDADDDLVLPGFVLEPHATDGTDGPFVAQDGDGALAAFTRSGERLWTKDMTVWDVLARAGGTAVVSGDASGLTGLDLATGEELWSRDDLVEGAGGYGVPGTGGAVTDGTVVAVMVPGDPRLVALDLADGSTRWSADGEAATGLVAVDGHLLEHDAGGIPSGGRSAATVKGVLRGLG